MDKLDTIYCHFSFRRPKEKNEAGKFEYKDYGIFAVAFYCDSNGTKFITKQVRKFPLWENHQFITAIQSYSNALRVIAELQGYMLKNGIKHVKLVTDNSTLVGWIVNPKKNRAYTKYMQRAVENYRFGGKHELGIDVSVMEARKSEKSYKYCCKKYVEEMGSLTPEVEVVKHDKATGKNIFDLKNMLGGKMPSTGFTNVYDLGEDDNSLPELGIGITELKSSEDNY